jgi:hypothetical protein
MDIFNTTRVVLSSEIPVKFATRADVSGAIIILLLNRRPGVVHAWLRAGGLQQSLHRRCSFTSVTRNNPERSSNFEGAKGMAAHLNMCSPSSPEWCRSSVQVGLPKEPKQVSAIQFHPGLLERANLNRRLERAASRREEHIILKGKY